LGQGVTISNATQAQKTTKQKRCRACKKLFTPSKPMQVVCSPYPCALDYAKTKQAKREQAKRRRAETRQAKQAMKTKPVLLKEAQGAFNEYIRTRDATQPCISCGAVNLSQKLTGGAWDCGHFLGVGAHPELRFEPMNAHKQCKHCNRDLSGNYGNYRKRLIERIGLAQVEWLEGPHKMPNYTRGELAEIRDRFRRMTRELKKGIAT